MSTEKYWKNERKKNQNEKFTILPEQQVSRKRTQKENQLIGRINYMNKKKFLMIEQPATKMINALKDIMKPYREKRN